MKHHKLLFVGSALILAATIMGAGLFRPDANAWTKDTYVADVLHTLGEPYPSNRPDDMSDANIQRGRDLFNTGYATSPSGQRSRVQSRYFLCTNCHLMEREDPDLRVSDPEARLDFVIGKGLPFLQGTTMYGTVNKVSWYNDDYFRKYGDLVKPARESLEGAIHLCSVVCSQGRDLEDWEMKGMLAYFWSISLKLGDLKLEKADWDRLEQARVDGKKDAEMVNWLKGFYRQASPATFLEAPEDKGKGYEVSRKGDPAIGAKVYVKGCMSCHSPQGASKYLSLDTGVLSRAMFKQHLKSHGYLSIYEIIRHGTHAVQGHRPYMPNYTAERMSNQQVEDLRAFIEQGGSY